MTVDTILERINDMMGGKDSVEFAKDGADVTELVAELSKARVRVEITTKGFVVDYPGLTTIRIRRNQNFAKQAKSSANNSAGKMSIPVGHIKHTYNVPKIAGDFISVLTDEASHNVWLTGPTQCGKDRLVHYAGKKLGRKVFQINCRGDMGSEVFFGEKTVVIDSATGNNKVVLQKGLVEQAMTEGLDEQGNEVEGASAGILFITEAAAMPAHVAIGINRLLESDDTRRTMVIDQDGGRLVRGHSKFRIVLASNTVGRGSTGLEASSYSAQCDSLDISLLNRMSVCFRMGYDREAERNILVEKIGDDAIVARLLKFRDSVRDQIRAKKLSSPFSTAHLIHIADMYRVFGNLSKAVYYVVFEFLLPEEKKTYNELAFAEFKEDLLKQNASTEIDYMD